MLVVSMTCVQYGMRLYCTTKQHSYNTFITMLFTIKVMLNYVVQIVFL